MTIPDGLYVAISQESYSSILSFPTRIQPADLKVNPRIDVVSPTVDGIADLLKGMAYWYTSSHSGHFVPTSWKQDVLTAFHSAVTKSTIRWDFNSQLQRLIKIPSRVALDELKAIYFSKIVKSPGFSHRLVSHALRTGEISPEDLVQDLVDFLRANKFFNWIEVEDDSIHWLTEFALRMANKPSTLYDWAKLRLSTGVEEMLASNLVLLHTAHLYEAAVNYQVTMESSVKVAMMDASWRWS